MTDTKPSEDKELLELKVKKASTTPAPGAPGHTLQDRVEDAYASHDTDISHTGAAEAAGVLTAVDEDDGDEEASAPRDFEYYSDGGDEE